MILHHTSDPSWPISLTLHQHFELTACLQLLSSFCSQCITWVSIGCKFHMQIAVVFCKRNFLFGVMAITTVSVLTTFIAGWICGIPRHNPVRPIVPVLLWAIKIHLWPKYDYTHQLPKNRQINCQRTYEN